MESGAPLAGTVHGEADAHRAGVRVCAGGDLEDLVERGHLLGLGAGNAEDPEQATNTAATVCLVDGRRRDIVVENHGADVHAHFSALVLGFVEVQTVAGVVAVEVENTSAGINRSCCLHYRSGWR